MGRGISILTPAEGSRALLVSFEDQPPLARRAGVIRYDLITGQETELISRESAAQAVPSPDGARVAALGRVK